MAIKSTIGTAEESKGFDYPKLMISTNGIVVLMTKHSTGTVLNKGDSGWVMGHYSTLWAPDLFKDYQGSPITLENTKEEN